MKINLPKLDPLPLEHKSLDGLVLSETVDFDRIYEIRAIELRGFVAVGLPYDGSQSYIDMKQNQPTITQNPYESNS